MLWAVSRVMVTSRRPGFSEALKVVSPEDALMTCSRQMAAHFSAPLPSYVGDQGSAPVGKGIFGGLVAQVQGGFPGATGPSGHDFAADRLCFGVQRLDLG